MLIPLAKQRFFHMKHKLNILHCPLVVVIKYIIIPPLPGMLLRFNTAYSEFRHNNRVTHRSMQILTNCPLSLPLSLNSPVPSTQYSLTQREGQHG